MATPPPLPVVPPPLIKLGMWGLTSRRTAFLYFWICFGLGLISLAVALVIPWALVGTVNFLGAWWYWAVIRWVDRNNGQWRGFD